MEQLLYRYVDDLLNEANASLVSILHSRTFRDYDPLRIPGVLQPVGRIGNIHDVEAQLKVLGAPGVDIHFTLEDWFEGSAERIAYRLFGEGTVPLLASDGHTSELTPVANRVRKLGIEGSKLAVSYSEAQNGFVTGDRLQITFRTVGIFRGREDKLVERWGQAQVG